MENITSISYPNLQFLPDTIISAEQVRFGNLPGKFSLGEGADLEQFCDEKIKVFFYALG